MGGPIVEGAKAPDFSLPVTGGTTLSLGDLMGRKVVLYFYPKDDTSGCTKEAIDFAGLRGSFDETGATIIGVSPDSIASHDRFKVKHRLDFQLVSDPEKSALDAYGVWVEKSMYGRKYMGVERSTFLIDRQGRIARVWRKVKVPGHAEEVLKAARTLP